MLWGLTTAAAAIVGLLLLHLYESSSIAQVQRAEAVVARVCDVLRDRFAFYAAGWDGAEIDTPETRQELAGVVGVALSRWPGLSGGVWLADTGPLAATALPDAALPLIREAVQAATEADRAVQLRQTAGERTLLSAACPIDGPVPGLTAWTLATARRPAGANSFALGLGTLGALVLGIAASVTGLTLAWQRRVSRIEAALAPAGATALPVLPPTGEPDLDRIVTALNDAGTRLSAASARASALAAQVAATERLASLGRMAAGIAHEIRNPMAAMRLRAENALAGDAGRQRAALQASLVQIGRVDALISELLAMTEQRRVERRPTALAALLAERAEAHRDLAQERGVALDVAVPSGATAVLDPAMTGRALDNLLLNALQHTPAGGTVRLDAAVAEAGAVRIAVSDTGPGIAPAVRGRLFEPFATGRADGTGLGLAIAREMAVAQGGRLTLADAGGIAEGQGACFVLDLPGADDGHDPDRR